MPPGYCEALELLLKLLDNQVIERPNGKVYHQEAGAACETRLALSIGDGKITRKRISTLIMCYRSTCEQFPLLQSATKWLKSRFDVISNPIFSVRRPSDNHAGRCLTRNRLN